MSSVPPSTSQVSLPSQNGAIEPIIASRSASPGASANSMPTPRSEPSMTTYIAMLKATASPSRTGRLDATAHLPRCPAGAASTPGRTVAGRSAGSWIRGPRRTVFAA